MAKPNSPWLTVLALHDQDHAHAVKWWNSETNKTKLQVWMRIQDMGGPDDPIGECVARFAQLGFEMIALQE